MVNPKAEFQLKRGQSQKAILRKLTDSSGNYRLRGLLPDSDNVYDVKVAKRDVMGSSNVERASPDFITVKVSS